jgi:alanyl-tRNA synthetase
VVHIGHVVKGAVRLGDSVTAEPDFERRADIMPNHTLTHVLNYALKKVLGVHVEQKGRRY